LSAAVVVSIAIIVFYCHCHCQAQWSPLPSIAVVPVAIITCCHHYCHCCLLQLPLPSYYCYTQKAPIDFALGFLCPLMLHHMTDMINKLQMTLHLNFFSFDVTTPTITINNLLADNNRDNKED
jgi:hypothetical protein